MTLRALGRDAELRWIRSHLGVAVRPGVVLLTGPAGIGKSHLADAATRPLSRWWVAFPHPRASVPAHGLRRIAELGRVARLSELLQESEEDAGKRRRAIFAAVDDLLSGSGPSVVVLDDAQWADGLTLDWLSRSAHAIGAGSTSLLLAVRTDSSREPAIDRALTPLEAAGLLHRLELGPLGVGTVGELARAIGSPVQGAERRELAERSGGSPLLVAELCRRRRRREGGPGRARPYARSLHQVVGEQLAEVGASARRVLVVAALAPQPPEDLVAEATGLSSDRFDRALDEALSSGLLVAAPGSLAFRHELHREAVDASLSQGERRRLHRRIADTLIARPDASPLQVAHQLLGAGDAAGAVPWLRRAGEHAMRCYDHPGAIEVFAEALTHCPPRDGQPAAGIIEQLVRACRLAARPQRGLDVLAGLRPRFADGPVAGHVLLATARLRSYADDYEGRHAALMEAERWFRRWEDPRGRVTVLAELAFPIGRLLTLGERVRYGRDSVALAEELGEEYVRSYCEANLGVTLFNAGDVAGLEVLERARGRLDLSSIRDRAEFLRQSVNLAHYHGWLGGYETARRIIGEARAVVDEPFWEVALAFAEGLVDWRSGRWDEALPRLEATSRDGSLGFFRVAEVVRLAILFERGESIPARELEGAVAGLIGTQEDFWASLALALCVQVRAWRREPNPTRGMLRQAEVIRTVELRAAWQDLLPAAAAADPLLHARLARELGDLMPPGPHAEACGLLAEGTRLAKIERTHEAMGALEGAATAFARLGEPYNEARALEVLSRSAASSATARSAAQRAAELYSAVGAARPLTRLVRASRKRGLLSQHRIPAVQRGKGTPGLTEREREVAELAGRGYTAEEIARELVISAATARTHLKHIRSKLGLRRTREIVRMMHE